MLTLLAMMSVALADGNPIISGELENTAHTLRAGENQLYLGTRYNRGVTDNLQVGTSVLGLFGAANVNAEYALIQNTESALSVAGTASFNWNGSGFTAGIEPTYTLGGQDSNRLNASLGYYYTRASIEGTDEDLTSSSIPLRISYDVAMSEQSVLRFMARSDLSYALDGNFTFTAGAGWYRGWKTFRLGLGVVVTNFGLAGLEDVAEVINYSPDLPAVYPLPYIRLWWRF